MVEKSVLLQRKNSTGDLQYLYPVTSGENILISVNTNPTTPNDAQLYEEQLDDIFNDVRNKLEQVIAGTAPYNSQFVYGVKGESATEYQHGNAVITKKDMGLDKVNNTSDSEKKVLSAKKLTNAVNVQVTGAASSSLQSWDGSTNLSLNITSLDASKLTGTLPDSMQTSSLCDIPQYASFDSAKEGETFFLIESSEDV